ncbi:hypothetical protein NM208_g5621 [Fusarium decemcellulare]|uniref:Uncharacterized protein n=1 Tax=Fusarium decemcellulare TaxID=57161 RepID=A0ACC1SGD2_9HYPO|nr:hypothetical protein NM208_g5621 [Fusarium decemcellulare]
MFLENEASQQEPVERQSDKDVSSMGGGSFTDEDEKHPEGSVKAWLTFLGAWYAMVPSMGLLNTHAVPQAWVMEHDLKGLPESQIGWIFSC